MNLLNLSWRNILAKPLNTMMSVLLFALSIGLITFLVLFNHQLKQGLDNNLAGIDLVIGAKGSPLQLILNSMYHIDAPTGNIPIG
jgi:putative ABC transport system permease protein